MVGVGGNADVFTRKTKVANERRGSAPPLFLLTASDLI
jgi:hypothetical protein